MRSPGLGSAAAASETAVALHVHRCSAAKSQQYRAEAEAAEAQKSAMWGTLKKSRKADKLKKQVEILEANARVSECSVVFLPYADHTSCPLKC